MTLKVASEPSVMWEKWFIVVLLRILYNLRDVQMVTRYPE
jgi:hypothetical protein